MGFMTRNMDYDGERGSQQRTRLTTRSRVHCVDKSSLCRATFVVKTRASATQREVCLEDWVSDDSTGRSFQKLGLRQLNENIISKARASTNQQEVQLGYDGLIITTEG